MILRYDQGMNTPHETPAPTDPTDLAREVLDAGCDLVVPIGGDGTA